MKGNWLVIAGVALGLTLSASATEVSVAFDKEEAAPGEEVQLIVSGVSDATADAFIIDLGFSPAGCIPDPAAADWNASTTWGPPWDTSMFSDLSQAGDTLAATSFVFDTFSSGMILTISMTIPDDGSVGYCDTIAVAVLDTSEFSLAGASEPVPEAGRGSDSIHIIPEPATIGLLAIGAFGALIRRKRR